MTTMTFNSLIERNYVKMFFKLLIYPLFLDRGEGLKIIVYNM